ncbi:MAG: hydroxymethylbilane synthase [Actinomycetota bacterium]
MPRSVLRIGTRSSALALAQAETVRLAIQKIITRRNFELVPVITQGDRFSEDELAPLGGSGYFVSDIQDALAEVKIDLAVHNAADLVNEVPQQVVLAAVPARIDPREALLTRSGMAMHALTPGTRVGVSSRRQSAALQSMNRGFVPTPLCGNVDVRLRRLTAGDVDALILPVASLKRLGKEHRITEIMPIEMMTPAVGQGLLAVQCRTSDKDMRAALSQIEDVASRRAFDTERAFLSALGGDPQAPVGAIAKLDGPMIKLRGMMADESGSRVVKDFEYGDDPVKVGQALAQRLQDLMELQTA